MNGIIQESLVVGAGCGGGELIGIISEGASHCDYLLKAQSREDALAALPFLRLGRVRPEYPGTHCDSITARRVCRGRWLATETFTCPKT